MRYGPSCGRRIHQSRPYLPGPYVFIDPARAMLIFIPQKGVSREEAVSRLPRLSSAAMARPASLRPLRIRFCIGYVIIKGLIMRRLAGNSHKATANGQIAFKGRKGGYGNVILLDSWASIQHTLWAYESLCGPEYTLVPMSVKGKLMGYVGMSGLATARICTMNSWSTASHRAPLRPQSYRKAARCPMLSSS